MRTVRLLWVKPPRAVSELEAEVADSVLDRGTLEAPADSDFPGPAGRYGLLPEEFWRTMNPDGPVPVFLHESYEAGLERWVNSLPDAAAEVTIVARVRDAVMQLVETRLAADPEALSASPTVTTTEPTPQGMAVVGRCVILRPARTLDRSRPSSTDWQTPRLS
jgi:hypothetical protein